MLRVKVIELSVKNQCRAQAFFGMLAQVPLIIVTQVMARYVPAIYKVETRGPVGWSPARHARAVITVLFDLRC